MPARSCKAADQDQRSSILKAPIAKKRGMRQLLIPKKSFLQTIVDHLDLPQPSFIESMKGLWSDEDLFEFLSLGFDGTKLRGDRRCDFFKEFTKTGDFRRFTVDIDTLISLDAAEEEEEDEIEELGGITFSEVTNIDDSDDENENGFKGHTS